MDLRPAHAWQPPEGWTTRFVVIDSHTGGEPFRVVVDGPVDLLGDTVLERRRFAQENLDHLRKMLMWEPRGHSDMYGALIGPPATPDGDLSVLFMHNEGFSTMCGHGIIALAKVVLDTGILPASEPETELEIDTPAGRVVATATVVDGSVARTRFRNVPSFVDALDAEVEVPGLGTVVYDLAFGGAFYAFVDAADIGLDLDDAGTAITAGRAIKRAIVTVGEPSHPDHPDLGFLYGVIFTGPGGAGPVHSRHVCVFADGEVDRSPTGTGVSARLAILHRKGEIDVGEPVVIESIVGSRFEGRVVELTAVGGREAVIPEVAGSAHITGRSELWIDPNDPLGGGFLLR
ncbi:MAG TPA: proline racemase family protein [Acidimicrobiia bacterium]|jgi:trans-L-3-hydroxyproline dehydratase|nr:proline racemase family protein [Acidimicrobiia bacterium]